MAKPPNIVLMGIDSLLATHMSCYGYHRLTTPHIDQFAQSGTLFERTYSAHIPTTSAYASMLTGHGCFRHASGRTTTQRSAQSPKSKPSPKSFERSVTRQPVSVSAVTLVRVDLITTWTIQGGEVGKSDPVRKRRTSTRSQSLNLTALSREGKPFLLFLRHMDPHSPYLPPPPYERMFYHGDEFDPANKSMEPVMDFKPFCDYFARWMPPGVTDKDYIIAQYDGAIAYMDACIQTIFNTLEAHGIFDETIVIINGDHGETLYDHECWFDHHGIYDVTLHVPLIIRYPGKVPAGKRISGFNQHKALVPTILELAEIETDIAFDGVSLMRLVRGEAASYESEFYITECTWMRKHGWRTPEWKLIIALEPDFHFKPPVELYNLIEDPDENNNLAETYPDIVTVLETRMQRWIAKREAETGLKNPIMTQGDWHGHEGVGHFKTSQQAYDTLHIGERGEAARRQAALAK